VHNISFNNKSNRFHASVWMRPKRQAMVVGRIHLVAVVVQKQEGVYLGQLSAGQRRVGNQVGNRVVSRFVDFFDATYHKKYFE
jgi:hypothetical protein